MLPHRILKALMFAATLTACSLGAHAQDISGFKLSHSRVGVKSVVSGQVDFDLKDLPNPNCGIEVSYGDGNSEDIRVGHNGPGDFPHKFSRSYANPGTYVLKISGKFIRRGLRSAAACGGETRQLTLVVVDDTAEKLKEEARMTRDEADRKARELADKEAELRQMAERLERERKVQEKREMELRAQQRRTTETRAAAEAATAKPSPAPTPSTKLAPQPSPRSGTDPF